MVKPVLTFRCTVCFTLTLAAMIAANANAQSPSSSRQANASERVARANWQPIRGSSNARPTQRQSVGSYSANQRTAGKPLVDAPVRTVDHTSVIPVPPPDSISIVDPPYHHDSLDGQVVLAPIHSDHGVYSSGGSYCDALPPGQCGCGDALCTGCDGGCDSIGSCAGGCCGNGCSTCGEYCSPEAWRPCVTLCLPQDGWVSFEYLLWWQDGLELPPLVTTSTSNTVPRSEAGVLGVPTTRTLFGGNDVLTDSFDGGRLRFGLWLDRCHSWGIGGEYFEIGRETETFRRSSTGDPILARPFFNTQTGDEDAELVAFPGILSGTVAVEVESQLAGGGFHLRHLRCCNEGCGNGLFGGCPEKFCSRSEMMIGYRYLQLDEGVRITENLVSTDQNNPGTFDILDRFETLNQFNGFDLGWMYRRTRGYWNFDTTLRLAVGNTKQTVRIDGNTTINDPSSTPAVQTLPGGLLTQTSNIGTYEQDEFSIVPEFNANLGYQLTDHLKATIGYTFIYWSNVVRPGDHISRDVNPNLLPPPADPFSGALRPAFAFDTTDYWAQGLSFGGEFRW